MFDITGINQPFRTFATAKNADMTVKKSFTWKHGTIPAGAPVEKTNGDFFVKPSYFPKGSIEQHDATYYGCRVSKDNINGL